MANSELSSTWSERFDVLRHRRGVMVAVFAIVAAAYFPFVAAMPNLYRATAKVIVEGDPDASSDEARPSDTATRLVSIKQLAFSRTNLRGLAERHHLHEDLVSAGGDDARLDRIQQEIKVDLIDGDASMARSKTAAFQVSYVATDPRTAAAVANTLASFYVAQNDRIKTRMVTHASELVGQQLEDARRHLTDQDGRLRAYTAANTGTLPQQTDANIAALERLNMQLRLNGEQQGRLMERRQTLQNQIAVATQVVDTPRPVVTSANDPAERLVKLKADLAELKTKWTDQAPDVRALQQQVLRLEAQVAAAAPARRAVPSTASPQSTLESALKETNAQLQQLTAESQALRNSTAIYESRVDIAPVHGQQLVALTNDQQVAREMYDTLLKKYSTATLAEKADAGSTEEFRVLDPATPPPAPAGPNRNSLWFLGLALSLAAAIGAAFFAERLDTSFRTLDELRAFTTVPVLATIPNILTPQDRATSRMRAALWTGASAAAMAVLAFASFRFGLGAEPFVRMLMRLG